MNCMSLPALLIAAFLAGSLMSGMGVWKVQGWRHDAAEKNRIEQEARALLIRQERAIEASTKYQETQADANAREVIVTKEVIRVVQKPVYREQCFDDDGMRIIASDIQAANARRGLGPEVPASAPAR
jgi:hypothetical protein